MDNQTATNPAADAVWLAVTSNASGDHVVAVAGGAIWINWLPIVLHANAEDC
jgi:hypothetical protein